MADTDAKDRADPPPAYSLRPSNPEAPPRFPEPYTPLPVPLPPTGPSLPPDPSSGVKQTTQGRTHLSPEPSPRECYM